MNRTNVLYFLDNFLSYLWLFIGIGIIVAIISERKLLLSLLKKQNRKDLGRQLLPFFKRLAYVLAGFILVIGSFAVVNTILGALYPQVELDSTSIEEVPWSFLTLLKAQAPQTGLIGVIMVMLGGTCLILSAGTKWLVNTAKLILTLTAFYLFFSALSFVA